MFKPPKNNNRLLLYGAFAMLAIGIVVLIGLMIAISGSFPNVFGQCVGLLTIDQEITTGGASAGLFGQSTSGSDTIADAIRSMDARSDIGAVVLVVNSPGGSVVATHEIYDAFKNVSKPKVAYFREVAASGGYYISTPADYIISDPDALTGSIGVITTTTDMSGLLEKAGINISAVKSGPHKDIGSPYRPAGEEEQAIFQAAIEEIYREFQDVVIENRGSKLNATLFANATDGRFLTGRQALKAGLVDAVGRKQDAIDKAAGLAGMPADQVRTCDVSVAGDSGGLFSVRTLAALLQPEGGRVQVKFQ